MSLFMVPFGEGKAFPTGWFLPCLCPRSSVLLPLPPEAAGKGHGAGGSAASPGGTLPCAANDAALLLGSSSSS